MTPIKKIYFASAIFGVVAILMIFLFILPLLKQVRDNSQALLSERSKMAFLDKETTSLNEMKVFYKTHKADLDKTQTLLINPNDPLEFINFLDETATSARVQIVISSMNEKTEKADSWPSLYINVLVTGSFPNFYKFLEKIENGQYLTNVLNLNINKVATKTVSAPGLSKSTPTEINVSMLIKVFTK
jgi:hypothetical protein